MTRDRRGPARTPRRLRAFTANGPMNRNRRPGSPPPAGIAGALRRVQDKRPTANEISHP